MDMTLTLLSVLANIMVISAVRDRYRHMAISRDQSVESLGKSFLKATTTFFWSTSAVPTFSVLSSPSPSLLFTLGKAVRNWFSEKY